MEKKAKGKDILMEEENNIIGSKRISKQPWMTEEALEACVGCSCKTKNGEHKRICVEGPVFKIGELDLDEY